MKKRPSARVVRAPIPLPKRRPTKRKFVEHVLPRGWVGVFSVMFARHTPGAWGMPRGRFKTRADAERFARRDPKQRRFNVVFGFEEWGMESVLWTKR